MLLTHTGETAFFLQFFPIGKSNQLIAWPGCGEGLKILTKYTSHVQMHTFVACTHFFSRLVNALKGTVA